jgi:NAD(P)-dependent dehydrogenase (short-subunit alcohol dehydrogenase family)
MQRIFIAGAASTSARALVKMLANQAELGLSVRSRERFCSLLGLPAEEWNTSGLGWSLQSAQFPCGLSLYECDATAAPAVAETLGDFADGSSDGKRLDGYAHFPGSVLLKPCHSTRAEEWDDVIRVNLTSAFYGLKAALGPMRKTKSGSLVFLSSVAATRGLPSHEAIAAAKAGVEGLVRSAAASYPELRVNCVAPGLTDAVMTARIIGNEQATRASLSMAAAKRPGTGDDIAAAVAYLLSDHSSYVTGQVLHVDGGMSTLGFPKA